MVWHGIFYHYGSVNYVKFLLNFVNQVGSGSTLDRSNEGEDVNLNLFNLQRQYAYLLELRRTRCLLLESLETRRRIFLFGGGKTFISFSNRSFLSFYGLRAP